MSVESIITENLDVWTSAIKTKSASGRGSSNKLELYGIKKLRELILELAIRGKLVVQDSKNEPASELLKMISAEREQLVKDKKIKSQKYRTIDEIPFELPKSWIWTRLPEVAFYKPGKTPPTKEASYWEEGNTAIPWVSISDMDDQGTIKNTIRRVSQRAKEKVFKSDLVPSGTMLMSFKLTVGKVSVLGVDSFHNEAIISLYPFSGVSQQYLMRVLPKQSNAGNKKQAIKGNTLNSESLADILIPLPPLEEQKRINVKIDELMTLCDQLESQTEASIEAHQTLVKSLLETLTNAKDADELNESWQRISAHFDVLFTTEDSIDQLKQTILQLAVMGKLVKQDPNDEPASKLLERIAAEKEQLIKDKKIKKQKPLRAITENDCMFPLSDGWAWCRFGELVSIQSELVSAIKYPEEYQIAPDIIEKGTGQLLEKRTVKDSGAKGPNNRFYSGQILYSKIRPSLSKAIIVDFDGLCSADMYPMHSFINPEYLLKVILSEVFLSQVRTLENRIKMPKLNIESLSNIMVPLAPLDQQQKISDTVESMTSLGTKIQKSLVIRSLVVTALADSMLSGNV